MAARVGAEQISRPTGRHKSEGHLSLGNGLPAESINRMSMAEQFHFFWSGVFSQWHPSPFMIDGVWYTCAEQYMMAEKARLFGDAVAESRIMGTTDPSDQKRYGRQVRGFVKQQWDAVARDVVYRASVEKFRQNPDLLELLLSTEGKTLVEASPYDTVWGIGLDRTDLRARNRSTWQGTNWLGECLMKARAALQGYMV